MVDLARANELTGALDWSAVVTVFTVYSVGVMIPGPNFVAVAHRAASTTLREAMALLAGIVLVSLFWASCAILGVGLVFAAFPWLAWGVKLAGAIYMFWFGLRLIFSRTATAAVAVDVATATLLRQAFVRGLATNISNPKSMAFFAAVFVSATPAHVSVVTFAAMLATVALVATAWYSFVAIVLSHGAIGSWYRARRLWVDRFCGGFIVALGARQVLR